MRWIALLPLILFSGAIRAQETAEGPPISLSLWEAIDSTVKYEWDIQLSYEDIIRAKGSLQEAAGPFDPVLDGEYDHVSLENVQLTGLKTNKKGSSNQLNLSGTKLTRYGTTTTAGLQVDQEHNPLVVAGRTNNTVTFFTIDQPLLRNFIYNQDYANELSACFNLRAVKATFIYTMSGFVRDVIKDYWNALAAKELLKIRQESLARLEDLTKSVEKLIQNGELARTEIDQQYAQVYNQKLSTEAAVQTLFEAYNTLRLGMGMPQIPYCLEAPKLDLEGFPAVELNRRPCSIEYLLDIASQNRGDYVASLWGIQSSTVQARSARNALLPELDLKLGFTMRNNEVGNKAEPFFGPLDSRLPQKEWLIGAKISIPLYNDTAKGIYRRRLAEKRQSYITSDQIYENMRTDIANAVHDHFNLIKEMKYADETVRWYRQAWEDEKKRMKEGYSTLFVVLNFEDYYRTALTQQLSTRLAYANNLADLYFLTGQLVWEDTCKNRVYIADVLTVDSLFEEENDG